MPPDRDWQPLLLAAGSRYLAGLSPLIDAADPAGLVAPRSRTLCAALGLLGEVCYTALGGRAHRAQVGRAAALLSLISKIDDQVIDGPAFHGGPGARGRDPGPLRDRVRAHLRPTLLSLQTGEPATAEARCLAAAQLGRWLLALGGPSGRHHHLMEVLAEGLAVQAEAVAVLSSHPADVRFTQVRSITRRISGVWLLMIALCGTLPPDAGRSFTAAEEAAIHDWGGLIQQADALSDLEKDILDGLISSVPGHLLWQAAPRPFLPAREHRDAATIYALCAAWEVDTACLPGPDSRRRLQGQLSGLGDLHSLLCWIHRFLLGRYLAHPLCRRRALPSPQESI